MVFIEYRKQGITLLIGFGRAMQYPSNSVNPWCLIIEYINEGIGFLVSFNRATQYSSTCQKINYGT
jgi:hypothetical protein